YVPLSDIADKGPGFHPFLNGQTLWLLGFIFLITSSLLGAVNFITTIIQLRAKGLTWMRLPFFVWAQFVTAFLLLLAFPPLEAAIVMQLMDRVAHTSFFLPAGLVVNGAPAYISGGGSPLLWQHLFWFLGHPEVYVLLLPALGVACDIMPAFTRKPLYGYRLSVYCLWAVGALSMIVWVHHMFVSGMSPFSGEYFSLATLTITVPMTIFGVNMLASLWGAKLHLRVPMLFSLGVLALFGSGGFGGLFLGNATADMQLHDTYLVVG